MRRAQYGVKVSSEGMVPSRSSVPSGVCYWSPRFSCEEYSHNVMLFYQVKDPINHVSFMYVSPHSARSLSPLAAAVFFSSRTFFKYYKVNLEQECPFWEEDGQCMMRDCSVCECSPEEIPKPWLEEVGLRPQA